MARRKLCHFGVESKKRLVEINETQVWLAHQVSEDTGMFVDSSYLCKVFTGERSAPKIKSSIQKVLGLTKEASTVTKLGTIDGE